MTDEAQAPPRGALQKVDDAVFRVETILVTLAALVMTTTVFLDVVYRSFANPDSQLAAKLQIVLGWMGLDGGKPTYEALRDYATPAILFGLAFVGGWAVYAAARRRDERPTTTGGGLLAGFGTVVGCYAFVQVVLEVPSRWVCAALLLASCVGVAVSMWREGDRFGVGLTALIALGGTWLCTKLPPQYIWSRELSLILLAWLAFLGASMATRLDKHIMVEAAAKAIPRSIRPWTRALGLALTAAFAAYFTLLAWRYTFGTGGSFGMGEKRPATQIPAWTITFAVVIAFSLMTVRFAAAALDAFVNPRQGDREPGH